MASAAIQDYVKQIYLLSAGEGRATTSALAAAIGVSAASATTMVKRLAELGLVRHERYRGAVLTPAGERMAVEIVRHHRLLETYLSEALGVPWDRLHGEAELLEHVLSEELEASIDHALGYPETDPHGDPIPSPDLTVPHDDSRGMADLETCQQGVVCRVPDGDPALLRYLGELGLRPKAGFTVVEKAPFDGPITVEVDGARRALARELALRIRVARVA